MSTLVQMRTSLRTYIGNPTTSSVADSVLTEVLNRAYKRICDRNKLPQLIQRDTFNTVLGTVSYNMVSAAVHILKVWNRTYGYEITKIDPGMLIAVDDTSQSTVRSARPCQYYREGNTIKLYPKPDAVYTIEVVSKITPTALASDSDVPVLNELWHEGIILLARWYYFDLVLDYPKAQYAYGIWQSWLADKPNELHQESQYYDEAVEMPIFSQGGSVRSRGFDF